MWLLGLYPPPDQKYSKTIAFFFIPPIRKENDSLFYQDCNKNQLPIYNPVQTSPQWKSSMSRGLFLQAFLKTTDTILCSELEDINGGNSECETENLGSSPGFTAQRLFNIVLSDHLTEQFPELQKNGD